MSEVLLYIVWLNPEEYQGGPKFRLSTDDYAGSLLASLRAMPKERNPHAGLQGFRWLEIPSVTRPNLLHKRPQSVDARQGVSHADRLRAVTRTDS